jgi:hypothetical protein
MLVRIITCLHNACTVDTDDKDLFDRAFYVRSTFTIIRSFEEADWLKSFFTLISEMRRPQDAVKVYVLFLKHNGTSQSCRNLVGVVSAGLFDDILCHLRSYHVRLPRTNGAITGIVFAPAFMVKGHVCFWFRQLSYASIAVMILLRSCMANDIYIYSTSALCSHTAAKLLFVRIFRHSRHLHSHTFLSWTVWVGLCLLAVSASAVVRFNLLHSAFTHVNHFCSSPLASQSFLT